MKTKLLLLFLGLLVLSGAGCSQEVVSTPIEVVDNTYVDLPQDMTVEERLVANYIKAMMEAQISGDDALIDVLPEQRRTRVRQLVQSGRARNRNLADYGAHFSVTKVEQIDDVTSIIIFSAWITEMRKESGYEDNHSGYGSNDRLTVINGEVARNELIGEEHPEFTKINNLPEQRTIILKALPDSPWNPAKEERAVNFKPEPISGFGQTESSLSLSSFESYVANWCANGMYNPAYPNYENSGGGGDCTNFVSQCLEAGQLPFASGAWGSAASWWTTPTNHWNHSYSWAAVNGLKNHLAQRSGTQTVHWVWEQAHKGDVVFMDFEQDGVWNHACVVRKAQWESGSFKLEVACHTSGRCHQDFYDYATYNHPNSWIQIVHMP